MREPSEWYRHILDSSALIAAVMNQPGAGVVMELIDQAAISAVNLLEVFGKLLQAGIPAKNLKRRLESFALPVIPWFGEDVWASADLAALAWTRGLSLGDRICLATALKFESSAVTADRNWMYLPPEFRVLLIR